METIIFIIKLALIVVTGLGYYNIVHQVSKSRPFGVTVGASVALVMSLMML